MDERGVSMPLQYVLLVSIIALLAGGLFVTTGGFVGSQHEDAVQHGLEVVGNRVATDILATDRLASSLDQSGSLTVTIDTPATVAGSSYVLSIEPSVGDRSVLRLESDAIEDAVEIDISTSHTLDHTSVAGGDLEISYDELSDSLEVRNV